MSLLQLRVNIGQLFCFVFAEILKRRQRIYRFPHWNDGELWGYVEKEMSVKLLCIVASLLLSSCILPTDVS